MVSGGSKLTFWKSYLGSKAKKSHRIMIWCGVFVYPAFGFLDYLVIPEWKLFLTVRLGGVLILIILLIADRLYSVSNELLAHISTQIVLNSLMWMLSYIDNPTTFSIYAINASTGFIASAIFLLWKPKHSVFLFIGTLGCFIALHFFYSSLSPFQIIANGALLLFTIALMTQFYIYLKYTSTVRNFKIQENLNRINVDLRNKNYLIEQQSIKIKKQNENLEQLNDLKDKLFMIIAHDVRSPLQSLRGILDLIDQSVQIRPEEFKMLTQGIKLKVDTATGLLENILIWTKSQMKGLNIKYVNVNIHTLSIEGQEYLQIIAEKKKIRINNETAPDHLVRADEDMTRLVIRNLLSNAIKFSSEGGEITIRSHRDKEDVVISVKDHGVGLNAMEIGLLFSTKVNSSRQGTLKEKGTGLGLMLCREFVKMNNGKIWVVSEPGKGSVFNFSLPALGYSQGNQKETWLN